MDYVLVVAKDAFYYSGLKTLIEPIEFWLVPSQYYKRIKNVTNDSLCDRLAHVPELLLVGDVVDFAELGDAVGSSTASSSRSVLRPGLNVGSEDNDDGDNNDDRQRALHSSGDDFCDAFRRSDDSDHFDVFSSTFAA